MTGVMAIPRYHLYGEALEDVERSFLHVESVARRSSIHDWTIRIHAHPDHHQLLLLTRGSGIVSIEDDHMQLGPGTIVLVSALTVHGYRFEPGSDGYVVTVSTAFMNAALENDADLAGLFAAPGHLVQVPATDSREIANAFRMLEQEFVWPAPGRRIAIKSNLQRILVATGRLYIETQNDIASSRRHDASLVVRYKKLIEARFRAQPGLPAFARELGVTTARLNTASRSVTGRSALDLVHDRIIIEAKRHLLYTGMTVAEIASQLGFSDPAYFNRFFVRRSGATPRAFRMSAET